MKFERSIVRKVKLILIWVKNEWMTVLVLLVLDDLLGDHPNPGDKSFNVCQEVLLCLNDHFRSFHDLRNRYDVLLFIFNGWSGFLLLSPFRLFARQRSGVQ